MIRQKISNKFSEYRFEIRHITIFFTVLFLFQIFLTFFQKVTLNRFLVETQGWYQKHSAERLAILTSTSLELLLENLLQQKEITPSEQRKIILSFNVIFKQQLIQQSVEDVCLIFSKDDKIYAIDSGQEIISFARNTIKSLEQTSEKHDEGINYFLKVKDQIKAEEIIFSELSSNNAFHILVPFVPDGEYLGVTYMKIAPNFSFLTDEVNNNFNQVTIIYSTLIFIGLIAIFYVSSQAVKERNEAQKRFYDEHEENLRKQVRLEKESLFTKRIYHTHHKADKIIGFIKDDIRRINSQNIEDIKHRVVTYSNFISRIIYDMKWYDQPVNTIVNPMFKTDINRTIEFIIKYVFLRISSKNEMFEFKLDLDESVPVINVNEFVVWEIVEPLIQNSIDHGKRKSITINIKTVYDSESKQTNVIISDNGIGIKDELLTEGKKGIKKIFLEHETTKNIQGANSGYGCYIAYQLAVEKCGWVLDVENLENEGCKFTITIFN